MSQVACPLDAMSLLFAGTAGVPPAMSAQRERRGAKDSQPFGPQLATDHRPLVTDPGPPPRTN